MENEKTFVPSVASESIATSTLRLVTSVIAYVDTQICSSRMPLTIVLRTYLDVALTPRFSHTTFSGCGAKFAVSATSREAVPSASVSVRTGRSSRPYTHADGRLQAASSDVKTKNVVRRTCRHACAARCSLNVTKQTPVHGALRPRSAATCALSSSTRRVSFVGAPGSALPDRRARVAAASCHSIFNDVR